MPNAATLDRRICVRLPNLVCEHLDRECATAPTRISNIVREELIDRYKLTTTKRQV